MTALGFNPKLLSRIGGSTYNGVELPGTYQYVCLIHPLMRGTIVVI